MPGFDGNDYGLPPGAVRPARPRCAALLGTLVKLGGSVKPAWKPCTRAARFRITASGVDLAVCKRCWGALKGGEEESPPPVG